MNKSDQGQVKKKELEGWQLEVLRKGATSIRVVGARNAGKTQALIDLAYNQGMIDGAVAINQLDRIQGVKRAPRGGMKFALILDDSDFRKHPRRKLAL